MTADSCCVFTAESVEHLLTQSLDDSLSDLNAIYTRKSTLIAACAIGALVFGVFRALSRTEH
jgi:hypothetical protein